LENKSLEGKGLGILLRLAKKRNQDKERKQVYCFHICAFYFTLFKFD
jgi:hypothetical protein